jgi:hypothetical protein
MSDPKHFIIAGERVTLELLEDLFACLRKHRKITLSIDDRWSVEPYASQIVPQIIKQALK